MRADIVIVGGGFAGVSSAFFLSQVAKVILLERESTLGYHSSGRSAEQYTVGITAGTMRRLGAASRQFLETPPATFVDHPLMSRRGCLTVGRVDQAEKLDALYARITDVGAEAQYVDRAGVKALFPALRDEKLDGGVYEPDAMDIDANALLQGYFRGAKSQGAQFVTGADVSRIVRTGQSWSVETAVGKFEAPLLLNAAGAWVDEITQLAGLAPIGLTPMRRTAFTFSPPETVDVSTWPHVSNLDYHWYVKPERARLMGSLADAVPTPPGDVYPDEIDVAQAIENIEQDTTFQIRRPLSQWAGLRNFVADKNPVCSTRDDAPGFFWLAGQGGCGVLTSPALGQAAASILLGKDLPAHLRNFGLSSSDLSLARLGPAGV